MVEGSMVSTTVAKDLLRELIASDQSPERLANDKGLIQVSDLAELEVIVQQVINENEKAASDVRAGEMKAIGYLVGQVMKASGGKANPGVVQKLLAELLK
jgi:aspartyl-tRNA(Asn)/glutamyl-tRNA(Gln) amidotransferase subunit B